MKLHFKMANVPTKLKGLGCAEMMVNSLNNKAQDKSQAALNVKMWKVSCPQGETTDSVEKEGIALLSEILKNNNKHIVRMKMEKTFSYRRQEVI